jgi:GAF domain-containing protein
MVRDGEVAQFVDTEAEDVPPINRELARLRGYRAMLFTPLMSNGAAIGLFSVTRREPGPFDAHHVQLMRTFADQAVIAINNANLFNETQEGLKQQTATADVLKVISRSAFDLQAVFDALLAPAVSLIGGTGGTICVRDGDVFRYRAVAEGRDSAIWRYMSEHPAIPGRTSLAARILLSGQPEYVRDTLADSELEVPVHSLTGNRSIVGVPLLRDDRIEGALMVARAQPGPFDQRQIELLQTFADQAVIAIENVRLFDEVQARTRDLSNALQQQTATADVLKVISRSAFDLKAVLTTLVESARRLCNAPQGMIFLRDGEVYRMAMQLGCPAEFERYILENPHRRAPHSGAGRAALTGEIAHFPDVLADSEYRLSEGQRLGGYRALLSVPLMRENEVVGVFSLGRPEPGAFTQGQIELVQTFADQAVIAIENVRLFEEVQARTRDLTEALQQQTATADVLKVISRSAFDLKAVLAVLVKSVLDLCSASGGNIHLRHGEAFRLEMQLGWPDEFAQYMRDNPVTPGTGSVSGRAILIRGVVQIPDVLEDPDYHLSEGPKIAGYRALLGVPLLRQNEVIGVFSVGRPAPGPFTPREIDLVQTFADQAVIAIENVRLFEQVQARTKELAASLENLQKAQDRLVQSEKLASLGQLTAGIAHEIKNPLNFVNNFSALSRELLGELGEVLTRAPLESAEREEADELIGIIGDNLDKVVQHGKRADSIVKNMLLHAREGSGERASVRINAMVEEALNLAYHGARAEKPDFNVTIAKSLDPDAGAADIFAQEITRVLLNLISNGFYATIKRKQAEGDGAYEPTIKASTRDLGESVEIAIRDNGTGIPEELKAKIFNPFFTTKPAGEGTGLGLSLSHDIVVKQHGGTIEVSTEPGAYTLFTVVLPRAGTGA